MSTIATSKQFTLNLRDLGKGLLMAAIGAALASLYEIIATPGGIGNIDWKVVGGAALVAAVSYLLKNLGSPAEIILQNPSPSAIEQVQKGEAEIKVMTKQ